MSSSSTVKHQYSEKISGRRRSLFPCEIGEQANDSDSDISLLCPLNSENPYSDNETENDNTYISRIITTPTRSQLFSESECSMSPLYLSPFVHNTKTSNTPLKETLLKTFQTPHDSTHISTDIPKLTRKSFQADLESLNLIVSSPSVSSREYAFQKVSIHSKNSKVRTSLFPEIMSVPTTSFYSKTNETAAVKRFPSVYSTEKKNSSKVNKRSTTKRSTKSRFGQINRGVGHGIKKPKNKKIEGNKLKKIADVITKSDHNLSKEVLELNISFNDKIQNCDLVSNKDISSIKRPFSPIANKSNKKAKLGSTTSTTPQSPNKDQHSEIMKSVISNYMAKKKAIKCKVNESKGKRSRSPSPEQTTKKFFRAIDSTKLTSSTEIEIMNKVDSQSEPKNNGIVDCSDLIVDDNEQIMENVELDQIVNDLEDKENNFSDDNSVLSQNSSDSLENDSVLNVVLKAHNSLTQFNGLIQLHNYPKDHPSALLSPTTQMCNMASGLAIASPKKVMNLTSILENIGPKTDSKDEQDNLSDKKLFPLFYSGYRPQVEEGPMSRTRAGDSKMKKMKQMSKDQMLLDAGQKRFGMTHCHECNIVYHVGDPGDEIMHDMYHNSRHILKFKGWKQERVVSQFKGGRVIQILPGDSKLWMKKIKELVEVIDRELGYFEAEFNLDNSQIYLCIKNKTIAGCVVAESKSVAHRMLLTQVQGVDLCSEESYSVKCGVSRIWVSKAFRKEGVGTVLMNALKNTFVHGGVLNNDDIAFSSPTIDGKAFATKYFQRSDFLIYYE